MEGGREGLISLNVINFVIFAFLLRNNKLLGPATGPCGGF